MLEDKAAIGQTVYHSIYGEGQVTYQDALWYYGVNFVHGEECVHNGDLYNNPVDKDGKPLINGVKQEEPTSATQLIADLVISINSCY